ncbi:MAG TPA: hypothetical protein ENK21_05375 [Trueperaceae bacterium]|nr:hypothetical protein [Trueperaceae bacterium]
MFNAATIIWGMIFGLIGSAHFIYGKKRSMIIPLVSGVVLFFIPYFIVNTIVLIMVGLVFVFLPFFWKI